MNLSYSSKVDGILSAGVSLEHLGINNWALSRNDALDVLSELELLGIAVLGGDVFIMSNGNIEQNYDSWYYERVPEEPNPDVVISSIEKTRRYIESYSDKNALFALVLQRN